MLDVKALDQINAETRLIDLTKSRLTAVQRGLAVCAFPVGYVDDLYGQNKKRVRRIGT